MDIEFHRFKAGSCTQIEKFTNTSKKWEKTHFPALFFLIKHPTKGYILVDTGYADHFFTETKKFPYSLYAKTTPVIFQKEMSAKSQLKEMGIQKNEINYIFITHFHADHISGLRDFTNATFICSKKAYEFLKDKKGIKAVKNAFIPNFLPPDFEKRTRFIEETSLYAKRKENKIENEIEEEKFVQIFETIYDLFGDGSLLSTELSGHAEGQFGLFFKDSEKKYTFLIGDASWDADAFRHLHLPSKITSLIMHSFFEFKNTLKKINLFYQSCPNVEIISSHCKETEEKINLEKGEKHESSLNHRN